ncbi:MAG: hypothetical protein IJR59_00565, partial [Firmicutes bacterium]|nr:hypothetical protein [Bacillota bacterium]
MKNNIMSNKRNNYIRKNTIILWAALAAMLLPLTDGQSAAAERAGRIINGESGCVITRYIPNTQIEWKTKEIFESIKNNFK